MAPRFAKKTSVAVTTSIDEVRMCITKYGGDRFNHINDWPRKRAIFLFEWRGRPYSFGFPVPDNNQEKMSQYRAVLGCIKFEFESVERGIIEPEQAFYAHAVVNPATGQTMFDKTRAMLPAPRHTQR